jgi:hypothetical protein
MCRDNFNDAKLSLHASGLWRFAHTTAAVKKDPSLLEGRDDRVWEKWKRPATADMAAVCAFQFVFPTSELALKPAQRARWPRSVVFVEPSEEQTRMTVLSLFVAPDLELVQLGGVEHIPVARLRLQNGGSAQLVAHHEPAESAERMIEAALERMRVRLGERYEDMPRGAYAYLFGKRQSGARFVIGCRAFPISRTEESV